MTSHPEIPTTSATSYLCQKCGNDFSDEGQLYKHRSLLCDVAFQCDFCTFNFQRIEKLAEHVKNFHASHANVSRKRETGLTPTVLGATKVHGKYTFRCAVCGKVFMSEELVKNHTNIFHSNKHSRKIQGPIL